MSVTESVGQWASKLILPTVSDQWNQFKSQEPHEGHENYLSLLLSLYLSKFTEYPKDIGWTWFGRSFILKTHFKSFSKSGCFPWWNKILQALLQSSVLGRNSVKQNGTSFIWSGQLKQSLTFFVRVFWICVSHT